MADTAHSFGQIFLGSRGGTRQGQLRVTAGGLAWKPSSGGQAEEVKKDEISGLYWTKVSRGCQLSVRRKAGTTVNFMGFRDKDYEQLQDFCKKTYNQGIQELSMSTSGRNWGGIAINGSSLMFMVDGKVAFDVPLPDVAQAQQVKDDIMMELHVDDTVGGEREDMLTEVSFHVPPTNEDFKGDENNSSAKVLLDNILQHTEAVASASDDAVVIFGEVGVLAPRGRFEVEMHLGFLSLVGQSLDFKLRYTAIQRIFILPKAHTPYTLVVLSLDPPIRKGQTFYPHVLCQFSSDEEVSIELDISPEDLAKKNEKCGGKLEPSMSGPVFEVFAKALRGLSGAKITRPGAFRCATLDGHSVRCSYKADDGQLYPLDRAFFYVHKPPLLLPYEDVESVEFARQGGGVLSGSVRTFDLVVRMKNDQEHQFRNIQRTEWQNLFEFINAKKLRIENLASVQQGPGGPGKGVDLDDEMDPGMRAAAAEADSEEDDEDFSGGEEGSDSGSEDEDSSDAEMIAEEEFGIRAEDVEKGKGKKGDKAGKKRPKGEDEDGEGDEEVEEKPAKKAKEPKAPKAPKEKKEPKAKAKAEDEEGGKKKKERKKKDPNAPKKAMSAFMFFSNTNRDKVKAENPGITFGEVGKLLGERWKALAPEEKVKYEEMQRTDKERYAKAFQAYSQAGGGKPVGADGGDEGSEGGDDE